jgi:hypothetical protein
MYRFLGISAPQMINTMHLHSSGYMENSIEKLIVRVLLASQNMTEDWECLNLGTLDPSNIDSKDWQFREGKENYYAPKAGEILFRLKEVQG